jgi:hypothetical protein
MQYDVYYPHAVPVEEVLKALQTGMEGLSDSEAKNRMNAYGGGRYDIAWTLS